MRLGRWLILAAIIAIVAFVGDTYWKHRTSLVKPLPSPQPLGLGTEAAAEQWCDKEHNGAIETFEICAANARQMKDPPRMELDRLSLKLYHKQDREYDLIESPKGEYDMKTGGLYSDAPVDITIGITADGPQHGRILKIHTSGVHFDKATGQATTDRPANFEFDQGTGSAVGADYEPNSRQLHLHSHAVLDWRGKTADAKPMHIEADEAYYLERDSKVELLRASHLSREGLKMDAGAAEVVMDHGDIKRVDAKEGKGVEDNNGRTVEFAAPHLGIDFGDHMAVRHIEGTDKARLVMAATSGNTTATGDRMDLEFEAGKDGSTLSSAVTQGNSVAQSDPAPSPGSNAETRVLRSDIIRMKMQPGGKDIASAETDGAATLDLLPQRPDQPTRQLKGDRIWITYAAQNHIQSFRSVNVTTRTQKPPTPKQPMPPPAVTSSHDFLATFDPKTDDLASVEQKTDFRYQEGDRQARSDSATLDQGKDVMTLVGKARLADPTGSTAADRIVIDQKTGDFTAAGNVASERQPEKNGKSSAMLSTEEVLEARAQHMTSTGHGTDQQIRYEGKAVIWQGADRITADRLDIDRKKHVLEAHGNVVSQFVDKAKSPLPDAPVLKTAAAKPATLAPSGASIFTRVTSSDLVYSDQTRVAWYQGGVVLRRPGMQVTSKEMRAFLKDSSADSSLDHAIADGSVKIVADQAASAGKPARNRVGTSEHAEYYADEGRVVLEGGKSKLVDSISRQETTGQQLTWWPNDDTFVVKGAEDAPAESIIRKKK